MRVYYMNDRGMKDDRAVVEIIGYDPATGKRRRPIIEFDANDLARLVDIAKEFRRRQRGIQAAAKARADKITNAGVAE